MKICIVGKYPPIEGGVSTQTYWLARGLARRGHEVHVVTNADEVEDGYRIQLRDDDAREYAPAFEGGGRVQVYNTAPYRRATMYHIPESNPFVSKLASVATDVVRREGCEVVLAFYYEPYAVAGFLASRWTGRPLVVKHAGSDLDRLLRVPDLATTYKEILRAADAVVTGRLLVPRFLEMGIERARIELDAPYALPAEVFHPATQQLDLGRAEPSRPAIGIYGKIGAQKGTFDLIAALGTLRAEGCDFDLVAMIGEPQGRELAGALASAGIADRTHVLPFQPTWRVPAFLRACSAVCFLERDFGVAIHRPIVPREVLACGTCLVVSREIATKQKFRDLLRPGENVVLVDEPRDHDALAAALRPLLTDGELARRIGAAGVAVADAIEHHEDFLDAWEARLARFARPPSPTTELRDGDAFPVVDVLHRGRVTREAVWRLYPVRTRELRLETRGDADVVHHRTTNGVRYELTIDAPLRSLLDACDGSRATGEIAAAFAVDHGGVNAAPEHTEGALLQALDWLYREGAIVFGEYRDEWGWSGGRRGSTLPSPRKAAPGDDGR